MTTHLSAVPAPGRAGTAAPTSERDRGMDNETMKWPWHLTNTDVIVRDPKTGATGEWPVIGQPAISDRVVVTCQTEDGGEGVFTYKASQRAVVRAQATYSVAPLLTAEQREKALQGLTGDECRFVAGALMQGYPEIFDAEVALLGRPGVRESLANPAAARKARPA